MALVLALGCPTEPEAYAVLAREAIVDKRMGHQLRALLLKRFLARPEYRGIADFPPTLVL
jgi:hypothetical protein